MNLATILKKLRRADRQVTEEDIRETFGDYHNLLCWLVRFLSADEKLANTCVIDACTIAEKQSPMFREWLIHWAARATVECASNEQHTEIVDLASKYERNELVHSEHWPLSKEEFLFLVANSKEFRARLDLLGRFVLVLCGIANDSYDQVAALLGISPKAVEKAYCSAIDSVRAAAQASPDRAAADPAPVNLVTNTPRELEAV